MTLDEAVKHLGAEQVRVMCNSGVAYDPCSAMSFCGRALAAQLRGDGERQLAFIVLMGRPEWLVRQACRALDELHEAYLEGSGRAAMELARRGALPLPERVPAYVR